MIFNQLTQLYCFTVIKINIIFRLIRCIRLYIYIYFKIVRNRIENNIVVIKTKIDKHIYKFIK